jgi:hypothetical protein
MSNENPRFKKGRAKDKQDTAAVVQGVSANAVGNTGGGNVEARADAGDQPAQDSPIQTARKLLQKMVQWVRKILRIDS